jgi:hypothetical protein
MDPVNSEELAEFWGVKGTLQAGGSSSCVAFPCAEYMPIWSLDACQYVWVPSRSVVRVAGSSVDPVKEIGAAGKNPESGESWGVHDAKTNNKRTAVPVDLKKFMMGVVCK